MEYSSLGIDFGTSNTLIAGWDEQSQLISLIPIPTYSRLVVQGTDEVPLIPSLIHYSSDGRIWIGQQVREHASPASRRTLRWMKQYIVNRSPIRIQLDNHNITPAQAAQDFLTAIFAFLRAEHGVRPDKVAFSAPVESFEDYNYWLNTLAESNRLNNFVLIDEPIAAAVGYGLSVQPGSVFLIFDFGGGTMHAAMVIMQNESLVGGKPLCRVLGKAGKNIGGMRIDQWLYQELLKRFDLSEDHPVVRQSSNQILSACERLKESLSIHEKSSTGDLQLGNSATINLSVNRDEFETILIQNHLFTEIDHLLRNVLNQAKEKGYSEDQIQSVLMIGGSSLIPSVQQHLQHFFGSQRVELNRPLDAVARGAALFAAGAGILDHIRHDYAIRYLDPSTRQYAFHKIVPSGTPYPTTEPIARLTIKASHNGQQKLGMSIFEIRDHQQSSFSQENIELIFDPQGCARIVELPVRQVQERAYFYVNEHSPTFLTANPPAEANIPRFEVAFHIDSQKRLTITARDLQTGIIILENQPVIRLT